MDKKLELRDLCRKSKDDHGYTSQDLEDMTGISLSTINNFFATASKAPNVYNAGAICAALGISLDKYFGIKEELSPEDQLHQMQHDRVNELKIAHLEGGMEQLNKTVDRQREKEKRMRISLYTLTFLSSIMMLVLLWYIAFDYRLPNVGLIRGGQASVFAWVVFILLAISVGAIASVLLRAIKYGKNITPDCEKKEINNAR